MKIFISYGRDLACFVNLVRDDLIARGHSVWLDSSEINRGDDWREKITSGILESDLILAFMSSYGLRKGGVCLDELAIAVSCSRKTIKTFAMEPDIFDMIPSTVKRIQYYDLSEYAGIRSGDLENWFESIKGELIGYILDENCLSNDWIDVLEARLHPDTLRGREVAGLRQMFISRGWIDDIIQEWVDTKGDDNIMLLSGYPGFGKSCYCVNYFHYNPYVCSLSLCEWTDDSDEGISRLIRNIAFNIAVRLPSYGKKLLWITDEYADQILSMSAERLFNILIVEPLITEIDGGYQPLIIVLDGLDRLTVKGNNILAEIIASSIGNLPDFVNIIISTRNDKAIFRCFNSARKIQFEPGSKAIDEDIYRFLKKNLEANIEDGSVTAKDLTSLTAKCAGSFLLAKLLTDSIIKGTIKPNEIDRLPSKLYDIFFQWMHRMAPDEEEFAEKYYSAFCILAAAGKPISADFLRKCLGWRKPELQSFIRKFSVILMEHKDDASTTVLSLFHKSFASWICDEDGNADIYVVDPEEGLDLICDGFMDLYDDSGIPDEMLADALSYLMYAGKKKYLRTICSDKASAEQVIKAASAGMTVRDKFNESQTLLNLYRKACTTYLGDNSDNSIIVNMLLSAKIPYLLAKGSFYFGDLITTENELEEAISAIQDNLSPEEYMDSLYMLGTAQDWLGKRDRSIESFLKLNEAAAGNDDYKIRALTGLIWNDHFTNAEEGSRRLAELKTLKAGTPETELSKFLIEARLMLTAGNLKESLEMYYKAAEMAGSEIWGYDSISVKNQMLMLEILVACFDNEEYVEGIRLGEKLYSRLEGHGNIAECYCASWIAANSLKAGRFAKADHYLDVAESIDGGTKKSKSAWISMHLKSIRAFLDNEMGKTDEALAGHLEVIRMAMDCNDDWVLGDACFEYIQIALSGGLTDDPEMAKAAEILADTASRSGLPHIIFKNRMIRMAMMADPLDPEYISANLDAEYSSTDMIVILYLLARTIRATLSSKPDEQGGSEDPAGLEELAGKVYESLIRTAKTAIAKNNIPDFGERNVIKTIKKEFGFELFD